MILAIDPGSTESGYVILGEDLSIWDKGKVENEDLLNNIMDDCIMDSKEKGYVTYIAIEMIASYGMSVGKEVFETCVWIGRFYQQTEKLGFTPQFIYRKDEKLNLCHSMKANDSNIVQALVDRFAPGERNHGKGVKSKKGWFYGFSKDIWQAYAVGITFYDMYIEPNLKKAGVE